MGGIGRTGLFLAALAKLSGEKDPVAYVRKHYMPHAVETQQQQDFIKNLKVWDLRWKLQLIAFIRKYKTFSSLLGW